MPIVERLQALARERGTNFKQLESICGIGNGVIRRWDTQSPRLDKLVKVANYLNVSLDYLVYGKDSSQPSENGELRIDFDAIKEDQGLLCDGSPLEADEADLVAMFRLLPSYEREDLFDLVYFKYKKHVEKKAESIYWTYSADKLKQKNTTVSDGGDQDVIA